MSRIIGIRHQVKKTVDGEARPTQVTITTQGENPISYELEDESAEMDFLVGKFPTSWRTLAEGERPDESLPVHHIRTHGESIKVPSQYEGFRTGDRIAMVLGGSGDFFAYALSLHGEKIGGEVLRIPPFQLKSARGENDKDDDSHLLAELLQNQPNLFLDTTPRDRALIALRESYDQLEQARKDRVACEQRIKQAVIGKVFCNPEHYDAGTFERAYDYAKANSRILKFLKSEEAQLLKTVEAALEQFPIWTDVLTHITGCGPKTAARIIAGTGDVRRFETIHKWKAYCGVHLVRKDEGTEGTEFIFPRRRAGRLSNWNDQCRQGYYLLVQYWMKNKECEWGQKFLQYKAHFAERHPEVVIRGKRKLYTKGHIQQMATARTMTRFAEFVYRQWSRLEREQTAGV